MLLHAPVFLNWVNWYKEHHAPNGQICKLGENEGPCKICLFHNLSTLYWEGGGRDERLGECNLALAILSAQVWRSWDRFMTEGEQGEEGDQEEDSSEYFGHLYEQLKDSTKPML